MKIKKNIIFCLDEYVIQIIEDVWIINIQINKVSRKLELTNKIDRGQSLTLCP